MENSTSHPHTRTTIVGSQFHTFLCKFSAYAPVFEAIWVKPEYIIIYFRVSVCVSVWQLPLGVAPPTHCCQLFCTLSLLYFGLLSDWISRPDDKRWNNVRGPFITGIVGNERQSLWRKYKSNACQTQQINFITFFSRQRKEDRNYWRCRKSCQSMEKQSKIPKYSLKLYSIQRIPKLWLADSPNSLTNLGNFSLKAANWFPPVAELWRKAIRITETKCIILYRWTV